MAITFVAKGTNAYAASGSITPGLPAGYAENDIFILIASNFGSGSISCSDNAYVRKGDEVTGNSHVTVWWKRASASETAPNVTGAASDVVASILAFRGASTATDPWDVWCAAKASGTVAQADFPALTTATAASMVIGCGASSDNNHYDGASSYGNLDTPRANGYWYSGASGDDCAFFYLYGIQTAAGSIGSPYLTQDVAGPDQWTSVIGALKPYSAGASFTLTLGVEVADEVWLDEEPTVDPPDPPVITDSDLVETNPLFDGTLRVEVARAAVPRFYHDFTRALLPGLSFSSTNPGGFGEATFTIAATTPEAPFVYAGHTMAKTDRVRITHGGAILFEGEITNDVSRATVEGGDAYYAVTAAGLWWKAGVRGDFCRTWYDSDYEHWFTVGKMPPQFDIDTDGLLEIAVDKETFVKADAHGCLYYWLDNGMGDPDDYITDVLGMVTVQTQSGGGGFRARLSSSNDGPWGTWHAEKTWTDEDVAEAAWREAITECAGCNALKLEVWSTIRYAAGALDEDISIKVRRLAVRTSNAITYHRDQIDSINTVTGTITMLQSLGPLAIKAGDRVFISDTNATYDGWRTVTSGDGTAFNVGVTGAGPGSGYVFTAPNVDDAMVSIADTTGLATDAYWENDAPAGNGNWGLAVAPHTTRADALEALAGTHSAPLDYGFWENDTFYCKERVAPSLGSNDYLIDSTDPGIDFSVLADTEESPTHVKVLYTFRDVDGGISTTPDGTLLAVYWHEEPDRDDAAVVLDVWDQWADLSMETGQAEAIGDQILAWIAANKYVGTVTIASPTVPLRGGGEKTAAHIRAGEYIEDSNRATGPLMITSVVVDVDAGVVTLGIGETRNEFVARMAPTKKQRLQAAIDAYHQNPWPGRGPAW